MPHDGGASSSATLTLGAPVACGGFTLQVWGEHAVETMSRLAGDRVAALRTAVTELADSARSAAGHPLDVRFGRDITNVLAAAERQLAARRVQQDYAQ